MKSFNNEAEILLTSLGQRMPLGIWFLFQTKILHVAVERNSILRPRFP